MTTISNENNLSDYLNKKKELLGTFQLNGSIAIHNWYNYLAGYSASFVKEIIKNEKLNENSIVLDPFCGVGTTNIVCKKLGITSVGYDINPFTSFVANTKLNWDFSEDELKFNLEKFVAYLEEYKNNDINLEVNETLQRAFSKKILKKLLIIKNAIHNFNFSNKNESFKNLYLLSLITILRQVSNYESFAPYLKKRTEELIDMPVFELFIEKLTLMVEDLLNVKKTSTNALIINKSAKEIKTSTFNFDLVITSPPYLNNWDYSWITKIELFFLDYVNSNSDLNNGIRKELVKSSTYLVKKKEIELNIPESSIKNEILEIVSNLKKKKETKKNGKNYDIVVVEYFNDIYEILTGIYSVMESGSRNIWVVGDSGLYDEHIKTDVWIGKISELIGFKFEKIEILRERKASRHNLKLQESVIYMRKD